ncbi:hypothetical protein PVAG01_07371 [Phlyctema vagabunda]|uniref:Uncharacterized protein n=1 Tax=Phlyctema vagabunda TaxID=108571 RepID=A0ABR4PC83_9HELO
MSTYDTNKYQFSIHKYRRNYSYLTPPSSQFGGSQYDEKSAAAAEMGAGSSPRYSLLPARLVEDDEQAQETAPLTGASASSPSSSSLIRQFSYRISSLTLFVRLFTLVLLIISVALLLSFMRDSYIVCIVFSFIALAEQLLVICVSKTSSTMAFRIRIELKRNDWKRQARMGEEILGHVKAQEGNINGFVIALDALAGVGMMVGGITMAIFAGNAYTIFPFFIMTLQWTAALLGFCNKETVVKFAIERPLPHSPAGSIISPPASVSYYDAEQTSEIGDAAPVAESLDGSNV